MLVLAALTPLQQLKCDSDFYPHVEKRKKQTRWSHDDQSRSLAQIETLETRENVYSFRIEQ